MRGRTLIRGATCVLPDATVRANILVEGSTIASVDVPDSSRADEVVEAGGLHLLPGVIDSHVHFRDPGLTHKEDLHTGSMAAAKGGVTTFFDMPNTSPATTSVAQLDAKLDRAAASSIVNYGFYIGATPSNLAELQEARRTPGIKIFIGSSTGELLVDDQDTLERIFAQTTLPICAHCEDEATVRANAEQLGGGRAYSDHSGIRDRRAAVIATQRAVDLATRHAHRFHVLHVSTADECPIIAEHAGLVTAEACPHHLLLTSDDYARLGSHVQVNPAVKSETDRLALWDALHDGMLQMVVTDHAPHTLEEKKRPYPQSPSGLPAIENSLALMLDQVNRGNCTLEEVVRWMCEAPARVWDVVGKGRIEAGADADLVLVDLRKTQVVRNSEQVTKCGWSPWDGVELTGWPVRTWVMGRQVYGDGAVDETVRGTEVTFDHGRSGYWAGR